MVVAPADLEPRVPEAHRERGRLGQERHRRVHRRQAAGEGSEASPEADRRTLIRRLSFDLTGLPPSPDEVDAFLADTAPDAYERLVDRLLASPHHGERWARHWMDLVHFAETHGHDQDRIRPNAWPYRDYLIAAFNRRQALCQFHRGAGRRRRALPGRAAADRRARDDRRGAVGRELAPRHPRRQHRPPDRPLHRPRRHGLDRHVHVREHDGPLRPLPRPQVRPDHPGGLLRPPGRLRRSGPGRAGL